MCFERRIGLLWLRCVLSPFYLDNVGRMRVVLVDLIFN